MGGEVSTLPQATKHAEPKAPPPSADLRPPPQEPTPTFAGPQPQGQGLEPSLDCQWPC